MWTERELTNPPVREAPLPALLDGSVSGRLGIRLFGAFELRTDGQPLPRPRTRKGHWLLALLILRQGQAVERSWLAGTLWPEGTEELARSSLRRCLNDLRRVLGENAPRLRSPGAQTLSFDPAGADVDLSAFDAAVSRGDPASLEEAISLYGGPLLEGCDEEWVDPERRAREEAYLAALDALAGWTRERGEHTTAVRLLRRAIGVDPLREGAYRRLFESLAALGHFAEVTLAYRDLRDRLHREIHAEPHPETTRLYERLRRPPHGGASAGSSSPETSAPLPARDRIPGLPRPLTSLVGREREVETIRARLLCADVRLLTLTGPAGTGKTRLALQAAVELLPAFRQGAGFVALASVRDGGRVVPAIVQALGVKETAGAAEAESLRRYLRDRQILLVLDNFEQVLEAAGTVADLLASAPHLKVLVTSREPLRVYGEHEFLVPPLSLPDRRRLPPVEELSRVEAVRLFIERARAVQPEFGITPENAPAVAEICRRLDGLPLAIELAAARARILTPEAMLPRLRHALPLLAGGPRDLPERHRTLRGALDWSHDLLGEREKRLWRILAVFCGGWDMAAAEAVCGEEPVLVPAGADPGDGLLEVLESLTARSLVMLEEAKAGEPRFRLLETVREYTEALLEASGEAQDLRRRHADHYLARVEALGLRLHRRNDPAALGWLDEDLENVRAALDHFIRSEPEPSRDEGLRLAAAMGPYWLTTSRLSEGRQQLRRALQMKDAGSPALRAWALKALGSLDFFAGDYEGQRRACEASLSLARQVGDLGAMADALAMLGIGALARGSFDEAVSFSERSLALSRPLNDPWSRFMALHVWGFVELRRGHLTRAESMARESLTLAREAEDEIGIVATLGIVGDVARFQGDLEAARSHYEEALDMLGEIGVTHMIADTLEKVMTLEGALGRHDRCARLHGAASALRRDAGAPMAAALHPDYESCVEAARAALGADAFAAAAAEGGAMRMEDAIRYALAPAAA